MSKKQKMTFLRLAELVLSDSERVLTYEEIWHEGVKRGLDKELASEGKTPKQTMGAQLYMNVKRSDSKFIAVSRQPIRFWLKEREKELYSCVSESAETPEESKSHKRSFSERDLHPLLVRFIYDRFDSYAKTIFHERSDKSKKGQDKWMHPDIVGVHFPFNDYEQATLNLSRALQISRCAIYSFELKIAVDFSNLKESYFQAVSNSSFANEGYLVVFEEVDLEALDEIKRLRDSFGIGLVKLDVDPMKSRIIFPAQPKELDLQSINVLADKNRDFETFIVNVAKDMEIADKERIAIQHYDLILSDEKLAEYVGVKKIVSV